VGQLARAAPASQSSRRFGRPASAGVSTNVSRLPLLPFCPPIPRFTCLRTAAGVSTGLACPRGKPTAPPDHSCWSQEWAIETTEAHRICKPLSDSQRIKSPAIGPPFLVRTCSLQPAACRAQPAQSASARRPEAVDTRTNAQRQQRDGRSLQKVIRKVWLFGRRRFSYTPFWFLFRSLGNSAVIHESSRGLSLDVQLCSNSSNTILGC
jgi:hypothetical protein